MPKGVHRPQISGHSELLTETLRNALSHFGPIKRLVDPAAQRLPDQL